MAIDPLTAAYLNVANNQPFIEAQTAAQRAQMQQATLQQMATQNSIQKQVQQENALKIQEMQRQQQEQDTIQNAMQDAFLQNAKSAAPVAAPADSTSGASPGGGSDYEAGVSGEAAAPASVPTAPTAATAPTNYADIMNGVIQKLGASGKIRPSTVLAMQQNLTAMQESLATLGIKQVQQKTDLHQLIAESLSAAYNSDDPVKQQQYWDVAWRRAIAGGEDPSTSGLPQKLPDNPTERKNTIESAISNNLPALAILQMAQKKQLADQEAATAQSKRDADARAQLLSDRQDAAAKLAQAQDADDYAAILGKLPANVVAAFPTAAPADGMTSDFKTQVLEGGMTPEQRVQAAAQRQKEADAAAKAAAAANLPSPEMRDYLRVIGAKDVNNPTQTEMQKAEAERIRVKNAERPTTNLSVIPGMAITPQQQQLHGEEYLSSLTPANAAQVRAVAEGRAAMPSATSRAQGAQDLRAAVFQYDPSYSDQRAQIRKAFTSGPDAKNIGNLNTAISHLAALQDLAGALDSGNVQLINAAKQTVERWFGGAAPTNYEGLRQAVAGEQDQALHGTSTIEGRNAILATMPAKAAPGQMEGIVNTGLRTMAQKLNTYKERYEQAIPGDTVWSPVLPSARAVLTTHGVNIDNPAAKAMTLEEGQSYLRRAGWTSGAPTAAQKSAAAALAQKEGKTFPQ